MIYSLCFHMDLDKIAKGGAILNGPLRSIKMKFRKIMQRRLGDLKKVSGVKKKSLKSNNFRDHLCIEVVLQLPVVDPCEDLHGTRVPELPNQQAEGARVVLQGLVVLGLSSQEQARVDLLQGELVEGLVVIGEGLQEQHQQALLPEGEEECGGGGRLTVTGEIVVTQGKELSLSHITAKLE